MYMFVYKFIYMYLYIFIYIYIYIFIYICICICIYIYIYIILNNLIKLLGFIHLLVHQSFYPPEIKTFLKTFSRKNREIPTFLSAEISGLKKRYFYRLILKLLLRCVLQGMLKEIFLRCPINEFFLISRKNYFLLLFTYFLHFFLNVAFLSLVIKLSPFNYYHIQNQKTVVKDLYEKKKE